MSESVRVDRTTNYLGAPLIIVASIVVAGLFAMFATNDFWLIVGIMAMGAFVGVCIQAAMDRRRRSATPKA